MEEIGKALEQNDGVGCSIFLMGRFNEYRSEPVQQAMIQSMRNMGTVIISAVIILSGTVPVMVKIFGKANWWPFLGKDEAE